SVNHEMSAIKGMLKWGAELEIIPPIMLSGIRALRLGPPKKKGYPPEVLHAMLSATPEHLQWWIMLNWLTLARPEEMCRLVRRVGDWVWPWPFRRFRAMSLIRLSLLLL